MAETFTVFYDIQSDGAKPIVNFAAGAIERKGKNKAEGKGSSGLLTNVIAQCNYVTITAENEEEAAGAIRGFLGEGNSYGKALVCKTSSLVEKEMI